MRLNSNKAINAFGEFIRAIDTEAANAADKLGQKIANSKRLKGTPLGENIEETIFEHRKAIGRTGIAGMGLVGSYDPWKD